MNERNNIISNNSSRYIFIKNLTKNIITADISNLKIYNKKEKINIFNFILKIFIFTLFIWILLYSNNCPSYRSWNCKNIENTYLETKRSLAESREMKKSNNEDPKIFLTDPSNSRNMQGVAEESLQSRTKQKGNWDQIEEGIIYLEEKIDMEHENMTQKQDECNAEILYERTLHMLKSNPRLVFLYSILLLPILSCILITLALMSINDLVNFSIANYVFNGSILSVAIGVLLILAYLLYEEIKKVDKNKL